METISTNQATIGTELKFNEGGYNAAIRTANEFIIPAILQVKFDYELLGVQNVSFNDKLYKEFTTNGISETKKRLYEQAKEDNKAPLQLRTAIENIDRYLEPLEESVQQLATFLKTDFRVKDFRFSFDDFTIVNGNPVVNTEALKRRYTSCIGTENQLVVYNQLQHLETVYNETVRLLESFGLNIPLYGLAGTRSYLKWQHGDGLMYSKMVEINTDAIKTIK